MKLFDYLINLSKIVEFQIIGKPLFEPTSTHLPVSFMLAQGIQNLGVRGFWTPTCFRALLYTMQFCEDYWPDRHNFVLTLSRLL